jgi:hypothetical protein
MKTHIHIHVRDVRKRALNTKDASRFKRGDRVWYFDYSGNKHPGVIGQESEKNGQATYTVTLEGVSGEEKNRWGYEDQFERR